MPLRSSLLLLSLMLIGATAEPPVIPVGLDAIRQWDRWPELRIGARSYLRSTYDRRGGNEGADASHFLYQLAEDKNVTLDIQGPGVLCFTRYNHWHGSPWHYEVDGVDHLVQETSTANPNQPRANSIFLPQQSFPNPLTWTWSLTKGADLSWVPIPFKESFRMAYSRTHYGTGYYIYQQFVPGAKLSRAIKTWNERDSPNKDVIDLIYRAGNDLVPKAGSNESHKLGIREESGRLSLEPGTNTVVELIASEAESGNPPQRLDNRRFATSSKVMLRALEFSVPRAQAIELGRARLRVYWDDAPYASIDAPLALLFGAGTLYNRDSREYLVKAFPVSIRFDQNEVHLSSYFPMPFFRSARIELVNQSDSPLAVNWSLRYAPLKDSPGQVGYFHATYRDHPNPIPGEDLVLLDTRTTESGGDWSGHLVGTSWIFSERAVLNTLEGDPRFFFDDSQTPQAQGTGTEEWGGGGDYWGGQNMSLPFAGHPTGARNAKEAKNEEDKIESAYRFLLSDLMPFGKNALIRLEHGGQNDSTEHYQTVTYWYGLNRASLVRTDQLKIGDLSSEAAHNYVSPTASAPYEITSRYEWGVDTLTGKEIYPAQTDVGRTMTAVSEFNLKLEPKNFGVLLRRKLDYQFPNQRAQLFLAKAKDGKATSAFKPAGVWYLAGANTCVYSNPREELGTAQHIVQTSNRRFRDDEFLLPRKLTDGQSEIRVRIKFTPVTIPLFPGHPFPQQPAWSEIRYDAYCFVMPESYP